MATHKGSDYSYGRPGIAALKAAGIQFVARYLSYNTTGKNLTFDEAKSYSDAGILIVSNWEYDAEAAKDGAAQGTKDAQTAQSQHTTDGGPADAPIYFSVDYNIPDAAPSLPNTPENAKAKLGAAVVAYFTAVNAVIGVGRTGAYGGYWAVKRLFDAGLITYGWQTYAWSGGQWDSRAQIRQVQNGVKINGQDTDLDTAQVDNYGGWFVGGKAPGSTPPVTAPVKPPAASGRPTVKRGDQNDWTRRIQGMLYAYNIDPGGIDGVFGAGTDAAVRRFQGAEKIGVDGIVGAVTWGKLIGSLPTLKQGSTGQNVKKAQGLLDAGYVNAQGIDGNFGAHTVAATKEFQGKQKITKDGIIGPATWGKLIPAN